MAILMKEDDDHIQTGYSKRPRTLLAVALLLVSASVACVSTVIVVSMQQRNYEQHPRMRRDLAETGVQLLPPWARYNLVDVKQRPSSTETPLFWRESLGN